MQTVEQLFRRLQDQYGRAYVPIHCYGHFSDGLYQALLADASVEHVYQQLSQVLAQTACEEAPAMAERKPAQRVTELPIEQLLGEIALKKNVVFVDTCEPAEFATSHIPGAINIPMRDLTPVVYAQLKQADRVISYCVKDFRGDEVARKMLNNGVSTVAVIKPHGLSGWQALGLPLVAKDLSASAAQAQLMQCARGQALCIK